MFSKKNSLLCSVLSPSSPTKPSLCFYIYVPPNESLQQVSFKFWKSRWMFDQNTLLLCVFYLAEINLLLASLFVVERETAGVVVRCRNSCCMPHVISQKFLLLKCYWAESLHCRSVMLQNSACSQNATGWWVLATALMWWSCAGN